MSTQTDGPLSGLRIIDLTRVLAGPYATMLLADLGADVIKIEHPVTGDDTRGWGPHWSHDLSSYFQSVNRNKASFTTDLKSEADRVEVRQLCDRADVLLENFRTGTMEGFGLGPAALLATNPGLVYCSLTGFGSGAGAALGGYDSIIQAASGLMSITGSGGGEPTKVGVAAVDIIAGLHLVTGVLSALRHRDRTGEGQHVEVDLLSSALSAMSYHATAVANGGDVPVPLGNRHPNIAPSDVLACADGELMLAVGNDGQFRALCRVLDRAHLAEDPRFSSNVQRLRHVDELTALLEVAMANRTVRELADELDGAGVPAAPVNGVDEAIRRAERLGLEPLVTMQSPDGTLSQHVRNPIRLSVTPPTYRTTPQSWSAVASITDWKKEKKTWLS